MSAVPRAGSLRKRLIAARWKLEDNKSWAKYAGERNLKHKLEGKEEIEKSRTNLESSFERKFGVRPNVISIDPTKMLEQEEANANKSVEEMKRLVEREAELRNSKISKWVRKATGGPRLWKRLRRIKKKK